jgi:ESCRT-II complex subunit VPS36
MSNAPVTLDMIRDERKWIDELARELASVLQGRRNGEGGESRNIRATGTGMMKERGIVALDEIWGGWNRARGIGTLFRYKLQIEYQC